MSAQRYGLDAAGASATVSFADMLAAVPVPSAVLTPDLRILHANDLILDKFDTTLNAARTAPIGRFCADAYQRRRAAATFSRAGSLRDCEMRLLTARGRPFWALCSMEPIRVCGGQGQFLTVIDITARKQVEQELHRLATTDPLTGALNRRAFMAAARAEQARARRRAMPIGLVLCDLDHFKTINDRHGHALGDRVLERFVALARRGLRPADVIGRLGGEEFALLLPDTDLAGAQVVAERLRRAYNRMPVAGRDGAPVPVSLSAGIADWAPGQPFDRVLAAADAALYTAKHAGRDRVVAAGP